MDAHFSEIMISIIGTIFTAFLASATRELTLVRKSIEALNIKMAVVIERVDYHDSRIKKLERKERI